MGTTTVFVQHYYTDGPERLISPLSEWCVPYSALIGRGTDVLHEKDARGCHAEYARHDWWLLQRCLEEQCVLRIDEILLRRIYRCRVRASMPPHTVADLLRSILLPSAGTLQFPCPNRPPLPLPFSLLLPESASASVSDFSDYLSPSSVPRLVPHVLHYRCLRAYHFVLAGHWATSPLGNPYHRHRGLCCGL